MERERDYWADKNSDKEFLDRIQVNYIRHCLTSYEEDLWSVFGETGAFEGRMRIKEEVLKKIAVLYPYLKKECKRQILDSGW